MGESAPTLAPAAFLAADPVPDATASADGKRPKLYGTPWNADSGRSVPFSQGTPVAIRFRAEHGGIIERFRFGPIVRDRPNGAHGIPVVIELQGDDGSDEHRPSGVVLASAVLPTDKPIGKFPLVTWERPVGVSAGAFYHLVFSRPRPSAAREVSLCTLYVQRPTNPPQPDPFGAGLALLRNRGGGDWAAKPGFTPTIELLYADGFVSGQGYVEVWNRRTREVQGKARVRQTFTVAGPDRAVIEVALRLRRQGVPGPLHIRLERTDGTLIEEADIPATAVDTSHTWVSHRFAGPHTFERGASYNLELSAPPGDAYRVTALADGGYQYGFRSPSLFADGFAQHTAGGVWTGWEVWGRSDRTDGDLQLYFTEAP